MLVNGTPTKIVLLSVTDISGPGDLDNATVNALVYVADELNPIWPGSAIPEVFEFGTLQERFTNPPATNYETLYPE